MLQYAAGVKCWPLLGLSQRMVALADGIIDDAQPGHYGEAATSFIRREMPILDLPGDFKQVLEQAGVTTCRSLSPALLRQVPLSCLHGAGVGSTLLVSPQPVKVPPLCPEAPPFV